jgi:nucleotide-binding universal stress UspA family protein
MSTGGIKKSNRDAPDLKRILVAVDGSENSERAFGVALKIAQQAGAELMILNVLPGITTLGAMASRVPLPQSTYDKFFQSAEKDSREIVSREASVARRLGVTVKEEVIRSTETIVQAIVDFAAEKKIDLIVVGTRGLGGFKRLLMGSVSTGIVTHAHCSVLVVR